MTPVPPTDHRVYLSASNRFTLALKTFGYSILGYLMVAIVILVVLWLIGTLAT